MWTATEQALPGSRDPHLSPGKMEDKPPIPPTDAQESSSRVGVAQRMAKVKPLLPIFSSFMLVLRTRLPALPTDPVFVPLLDETHFLEQRGKDWSMPEDRCLFFFS